jgi:orotate phosphoribosyltransferase
MMNHHEKLDLLASAGVLQTGHFKLTSGRHSDRYLQCARLFENPDFSEIVCGDIADSFKEQSIDLVIGPALGGIIMAYEVARKLAAKNIFAERENGVMTLRRGFAITPGARVLVVEDTITTGGSVQEVLALVLAHQGVPVGVGAVADRSGGKVDFKVPLAAFVSMVVASYPAETCPLCAQGLPIVKPGSRNI